MKDREELLKEDIEELKKELKESKFNHESKSKKEPLKEKKEDKGDEKKILKFDIKKFAWAGLPFIIIVVFVVGILIGRSISSGNNDAQKTNETDLTSIQNNIINNQPVQEVKNLFKECYETDSIIDIYNYGELTANSKIYKDSCVNNQTLNEYYCDDNKEPQVRSEKCIYCEKGECVNFHANKEGCMESDAAIDIYQNGYVYDLNKKLWGDYCTGSTLIENYCNSFGYREYTSKLCENGCQDGACLTIPKSTNIKCKDGDGGVVYDLKATVVDINLKTGTDICRGDKTLEEYYCDGFGYIKSNFKICDYKCVNGSCVPALI